MANRRDWTQPQVGPMGFAGTAKAIGRTVNLSLTDLVTGNTVEAFRVPAGFMVTGIAAVASDMDSATGLTLSVGDAALGTRFLNASAIGQAATLTQAFTTPAATNVLFLYTVDTTILITVTAQPTGASAGTVALYLLGFMVQ